jgi:signal transduction histidine kinase
VRHYVYALVHPSAQQDALTAVRHRAFIASRLIGSLTALAAFPLYLTLRGVPSRLELIVVGWLVAPILIAYVLSRTGRYELAYALWSIALTVLVTLVAIGTGGIGSFAAVWLVLVPLDASLSASRCVVVAASTFALVAAGLLLAMHALHLDPASAVPASAAAALAAGGIISAILYASGLALGAESRQRNAIGSTRWPHVPFVPARVDTGGAESLSRTGSPLVRERTAEGAVAFDGSTSSHHDIAPEPVALGRAIATCCELLALRAGEAGITLVRRIERDLPDVVVDQRALKQILLTLLSNAIRLTDRDGKVTVSAVRDGEMAAIAVMDTGIATDDPSLPGAGRGLSIVKDLVRLHGGQFDAGSRRAGGATVTVRLPIDGQPMRRRGALTAPAASRVVALRAPTRTGMPVRKIA